MDMRHIYGFKVNDPEVWGDVFCEDKQCPEELISSACHMYFDSEGDPYIGFDLLLDIPYEEMRKYLLPYSSDLVVRKVLMK